MTREQQENNQREKERQQEIGKERQMKWDPALLAWENCHLSNVRPLNGDAVGSAAANYIIYSHSFAKVDTGKASKDWSKILF